MEYDAGQGEHLSAPQGSAVQFADSEPARPEAEAPHLPARQLDIAPALPRGAASTREPVTAAEIADETLDDDDERPTVETQAWLKKDDYWQRTTYIAVTGRQTAAAPHTRPLPRPHRFRRPSPLRSTLILTLTLALIVLIPLGVIFAQHEAEIHIKLPTSIPGLTQPAATHTPAPSATARPTTTPKKK
jgi:hypothetical protein